MNALPSEILFEAELLVVRDTEDGSFGIVTFHGVRIPVNLSLLKGIQPGNVVLVEGRIALSKVVNDHEIY